MTAKLSDYDQPSVTVDLCLLTVADGVLSALVLQRPEDPDAGAWALPGGFVQIDETLDAAADRVLREKAKIPGAFIEQLYTFGDLGRDPRGRVITVAYYALIPFDQVQSALQRDNALSLAGIDVPWAGETGGPVHLRTAGDGALTLAFDHADIFGQAVKRLRGKLDYSAVGVELLPDLFTLRQLQEIHQAILNKPLNKPAFRRKVLDRGHIRPTGQREAGVTYRPAELYRRS